MSEKEMLDKCLMSGGKVFFRNARKQIKDYLYASKGNGKKILIVLFTDGSNTIGIEKLTFILPDTEKSIVGNTVKGKFTESYTNIFKEACHV